MHNVEILKVFYGRKNRRAFIFFLIYKPPVLLFLQDNADFFLGERHLFPLPAGTEISGKKHCDTDEKDNRGDSLAVLFSDIIEIIFRKGRSLLCR